MSKLAALLGGMTLTDLAKEVLGSQGRGGDTELAHVNKREAALLKSQGGSGTVNPETGMPEFYDGMDYPMDMGVEYSTDVEAQPGGFYGDVGQPTPSFGGGEISPTPQINFEDPRAVAQTYPELYPGGVPPIAGEQTRYAPGVAPAYEPATAIEQAPVEPGLGDTLKGYAKSAEQLAKEYPTLTRGLGAVAGGIPGLIRARQARGEAARTRAEMEQMAAPIRAVGEEQLAAGQRGELTAAQQQQIQAARAAARQDLTRRGVTSGTAAQQAENRIIELAQRFAQTNIDNGVRLIGAANSYNAAAIQQAYRMNQDANTMTQNYFTNLMRAFGALPTTQTTTTRTE